MNDKQKLALLIGVLSILAMSIYPPWIKREIEMTPTYSYTITQPGPYGFILDPPPQGDLIDLRRLGVQWAAVLVVTVGLIVSLMDKKKYQQDGNESKE